MSVRPLAIRMLLMAYLSSVALVRDQRVREFLRRRVDVWCHCSGVFWGLDWMMEGARRLLELCRGFQARVLVWKWRLKTLSATKSRSCVRVWRSVGGEVAEVRGLEVVFVLCWSVGGDVAEVCGLGLVVVV